VTGQPTTRSPEQIREAATGALKKERLYPSRSAEMEELLFEEQLEGAT
jgi:hypothetical protein